MFQEWEIMAIDDFFESLEWNVRDRNPRPDFIRFADLMRLNSTQERWSYKGSLTTPPCTETIYWNVMHTVLPIKQKHLDLFKG